MNAPHEIRRPNRRYVGTTNEVIEKLRADGHSTDWYKPTEQVTEAPQADKCGYFTLYYLEDSSAYTVDHEGEKYLEQRQLQQPEAKPCWYCAGCKTRFFSVQDALAHRGAQ